MQVVLIATNEHTNLEPLGRSIPPALIPVANQPAILYNIDLLARQGHRTILTCLHHQAGAVESCLGSGQRWGVSLQYLLQRDSFGAAGPLAWARSLLNERFLVLPAHTLIDLDIAALVAQHSQQGNVATQVVQRDRSTGVYLFEPQVLKLIPRRTPFDIDTQLIPALAAEGLPVGRYSLYGYWNPLETYEQYREAQQVFLNSDSSIHQGSHAPLVHLHINHPSLQPGLWVGANTAIHPSAHISPPVLIGENSRVGRDVELGPNAIIGANVVVDDGATVRDSAILDNTYLGQFVNIVDRIVRPGQIIDTRTGQSVDIIDEFLIGATYESIEESLLRRIGDALLALLLICLSLPFTILLGVATWVVFGRVFATVPRLHPAKRLESATRRSGSPSSTTTFQLLRFATHSSTTEQVPESDLARFSPFGDWLERWQLQRIPELWNVLAGDLRLVGVCARAPGEFGPHPEPWQEQLLHYQPGLTGFWFTQCGPDSMPEEVQLADAYYSATRSPALDFSILRQTPAAWWRRARKPTPTIAAKRISI